LSEGWLDLSKNFIHLLLRFLSQSGYSRLIFHEIRYPEIDNDIFDIAKRYPLDNEKMATKAPSSIDLSDLFLNV